MSCAARFNLKMQKVNAKYQNGLGKFPQNNKSGKSTYFNTAFLLTIESVEITKTSSIFNMKLLNLTSKEMIVIVGNGEKMNKIPYFNSMPCGSQESYIIDDLGDKYFPEKPVWRGEASKYIFQDMGWGGNCTDKLRLLPNSVVKAYMVFPKLPVGSSHIKFVIPNNGGWHSEIQISEIQLVDSK